MGRADVKPSRRANVAAALVIVLAGLLGAAWAFVVPIFQATDEAAHFDYAMSILTEGHLIGTSGTQVGWIVSPYTRYLLGTSDYFRIAFHSSMRVPSGYGTLAYFRRVDAGANRLANVDPPPGEVSYIASAYPFGFYALEAAWMKLISLATGSLVAMFFGARILCVLLTMLGLYFNYRTALNIGIPRWSSVALVAAIGFFPLTTLVSSYVQPDNLGYALVSATLFFATQLRRSRWPLTTTAALGAVLGALAVTKYHFFLSVAVPVVLLVVARLWLERAKPATSALRILTLFFPTVVLVTLQFAVATPAYVKRPTSGVLASTASSLQSGLWPTILHMLANVPRAFADFFVAGPNAATYWGELGLWDTPLIVVNTQIELMLRILFSVGSIAVFGAIVYRVVRDLARLRAVASRVSPRRAALIATSDPLLNAYVLFTLMMIGLYVVTDNVFGAVGRQWYPYVFAPFLCTAWYAPRTFRPLRNRWPAAIAVALCTYSVVASGYATAEMFQRYYGAPNASYTSIVPASSQIARSRALGFLWPIQGMDFHPLAARRFRYTFLPGSRLWAGGAAIFPQEHGAASNVAVVIDGRVPARTVGGLYNFEIAEGTRDFTYAYSGFYGPFATRGLREGVHTVTAYAMDPQRQTFAQLQPRRTFFLVGGERFTPAFLEKLSRAPQVAGSLHGDEHCGAGVALVDGTLKSGAPSGSVVWLLAGGKPYPARYGAHGRTFFATIPTSGMSLGLHDVLAYIADPPTDRYERIGGTLALRVEALSAVRGLAWQAPPAPVECHDPLDLLAAT